MSHSRPVSGARARFAPARAAEPAKTVAARCTLACAALAALDHAGTALQAGCMIGWVVAALSATVAVWALARASYWKWMWEGERRLNHALLKAAHREEARAADTVGHTVPAAEELTRTSGEDAGRSKSG